MYQNVVIGKPLVHPSELLSGSKEEWEQYTKKNTLFTEERFLPKILVEAGVVKSVSEVRRNKPELVVNLESLDFLSVKWGKKHVWILVGE